VCLLVGEVYQSQIPHPVAKNATRMGHSVAELGSNGQPRRLSLHRHFLDQAGADAAEEVFAVGFGLGQDFWLVAILEGDFLQEEFDCVFGLEALGDQFADAWGEAVGIVGGTEAGEVVGTFVIAEFARRQAVEGGLGFGIVEERGERRVPFALRAGPSMERMAGGPDEFSGGFLLQGAAIGSAIHSVGGSRP
jgi:hypothetical protein